MTTSTNTDSDTQLPLTEFVNPAASLDMGSVSLSLSNDVMNSVYNIPLVTDSETQKVFTHACERLVSRLILLNLTGITRRSENKATEEYQHNRFDVNRHIVTNRCDAQYTEET